MVRTRLNIGCRYSTPVLERPLHPTRSQFKPQPSQTQAPVTPATEPERRAGGGLTTPDDHRHVPARHCDALRLAKQAPPPEHLVGVEVVALGGHRHRDPRLMGLRNDLTLLRLAPTPATAANRSVTISARILLSNRHRLSVHQEISGHLRSAHSQTTQPAQTHPIRTGGLRRRLTFERGHQCTAGQMPVVVPWRGIRAPSDRQGTIGLDFRQQRDDRACGGPQGGE